MSILPPIKKKRYNQEFRGVFGTFGRGGDAQVMYLQTAIKPAHLDKLTLISEIPSSETWSVRDLFQREVDDVRVTKQILPYFQDDERVKFFNPLTLTILPLRGDARDILEETPELTEDVKEIEGSRWQMFEAEGFYRYRHVRDHLQYGVIDWNDETVEVVAIDGQHRLSALKRYSKMAARDSGFFEWWIPVVVFVVVPGNQRESRRTILDVVRNIFVYINKEARPPSRARQILLSDESINAIATQEVLEYAHSNDVRPRDEREADRLPLLVFDWRGQEREGRHVPAPSALISIVELRDWFESYLLGEDFKSKQQTALGVQPTDTLYEAFSEGRLPLRLAEEVRRQFQASMLRGLTGFLEGWQPYRAYIERLRRLEVDWTTRSDIAYHAFHQLRFGSHNAPKEQYEEVDDAYKRVVEEIEELKQSIPMVLRQDIGMRGVISAFGLLRRYYNRSRGSSIEFEEYTRWYVNVANSAYEDGWFDMEETRTEEILTHIVQDSSGRVVNYRLAQAEQALGAFLTGLLASYGHARLETPNLDVLEEIWEELLEVLDPTLQKGYRKDIRAKLKRQYPTKSLEYTERLKAESLARTSEHLERIASTFREVASS